MVWNRFVRFCEGMLGRGMSLDGVTQRTKVSIVGEVVSPNTVESPISPVKVALLDWCVFGRSVVYGDQPALGGSHPREVLRKLAWGRFGDQLVVKTESGTVSLPLARVRFDPHAPMARNAQPLMQKPFPEMAAALARVPDKSYAGEELYYGERFVSKGDRVSLRAVVEPAQSAGAGPYRGTQATADFRVVDDDERPRLREIL